jgi:hypothetical protein
MRGKSFFVLKTKMRLLKLRASHKDGEVLGKKKRVRGEKKRKLQN